MNTVFRLRGWACGLGLLCTCATASAQDSHAYMGLTAGQAHGEFDAQTLLQHPLPLGSSLGAVSHDRGSPALKLFGGYRFNSFWALEGGYFHLGDLGVQALALPTGGLSGRVKLQGMHLDVVGLMPLGADWALSARVGGVYARTVVNYQGEGGLVPRHDSISRSTGSVKLGLGVQYALSRRLTLRLDAERYRFDDAAAGHGIVHVYTLGLQTPTD
jgi:OOP family OmpA-OmpF porin